MGPPASLGEGPRTDLGQFRDSLDDLHGVVTAASAARVSIAAVFPTAQSSATGGGETAGSREKWRAEALREECQAAPIRNVRQDGRMLVHPLTGARVFAYE